MRCYVPPRAMRFLLVCMLTISGIACGGAAMRVVDRTPSGGVVAIQPESDSSREQAERYMTAQCPLGYEIVRDAPPAVVSKDDEQRIRFQCKSASDAPAQPHAAREVAVHI